MLGLELRAPTLWIRAHVYWAGYLFRYSRLPGCLLETSVLASLVFLFLVGDTISYLGNIHSSTSLLIELPFVFLHDSFQERFYLLHQEEQD